MSSIIHRIKTFIGTWLVVGILWLVILISYVMPR